MLLRPTARWPLILAAIFSLYSGALLWKAFQSQAQLRTATDARLIADSKRRASALADFGTAQRGATRELAEAHELRTYLINKALGMSPRYGLNANLDAIVERFRERIENDSKLGTGPGLQRIAFFGHDGQVLADTMGDTAPPIARAGPVSGTTLTVDTEKGWIVATAPVLFKGEASGSVATWAALPQLYRFLIHLEGSATYRETLLTASGKEIVGPDGKPLLPVRLAEEVLSLLPEDQPRRLSDLTSVAHEESLGNVVAIKTSVSTMPVSLVTTMSASEIYGGSNAGFLLETLSVFPLLVILAAVWVDRLRVRAAKLAWRAARSDSRRQALQGENAALSVEIRRREAVEQALKDQQDHLEELVNQRTAELNSLFLTLPDLYFRLRRDGTILDYRAGREAELDVSAADPIGKRLQDVLPADVARNIAGALDELTAGKDQSACEFDLSISNHCHYYEARALPLDQEQRVVVVRNITDRKVIEEARESNRREAERLARIKSEFLANMSHEIRTPLNGILGMAQVGLRKSAGRSSAEESFRKILQSGRLLLGIINDILDLSKIEAGKLRIESLPLNLPQLLEDIIEILQAQACAKGIGLSIDKGSDLPAGILGDPLRIEQILLNLLSNAVKFTERGSVVLVVRREADTLVLGVRDTGVGMSPDQIERLFAPFEQADGSTTRKFGGTGLGLSIAKRLVELMAGEIRVASQPGQGTLFEVRLPLIVAPDAVPDGPASAPVAPTGPRLAGLSLLVAEDNEVNQLVVTEFLTEEGAQVTLAGDGQQAIDRIVCDGADAFHLVLMDIQMPVMDGYEATRRIREIAPNLPVVGQTAHALAEEREQCLAAGMVDHLAKPLEVEDLVAVVLRRARRSPLGGGEGFPSLPESANATRSVDERIDWLALQARLRARTDFCTRLAATLLEGQQETPRRLRQAIDSGNGQALAEICHDLKGMAGNVGLGQLQSLASSAEQAARKNHPEATVFAQSLVGPLEQLLADAKEYLDTARPEAQS
ncbi:MAG: ATP-binding protein [Rhodocyclaceae bacterium]